jgi:hypothetical protein
MFLELRSEESYCLLRLIARRFLYVLTLSSNHFIIKCQPKHFQDTAWLAVTVFTCQQWTHTKQWINYFWVNEVSQRTQWAREASLIVLLTTVEQASLLLHAIPCSFATFWFLLWAQKCPIIYIKQIGNSYSFGSSWQPTRDRPPVQGPAAPSL